MFKRYIYHYYYRLWVSYYLIKYYFNQPKTMIIIVDDNFFPPLLTFKELVKKCYYHDLNTINKFYKYKIENMHPGDLVEMTCSWVAATKKGDIRKDLKNYEAIYKIPLKTMRVIIEILFVLNVLVDKR